MLCDFEWRVRIKVPTAHPYRYPDVAVVCGKPMTEKFMGQVMLVIPLLLVEVLSPTTKAYDKDGKFIAYQSIESFQEYLLVEQRAPARHTLCAAGGQSMGAQRFYWVDSAVELKSLGVTLELSEIYQAVEFAPSTELLRE
ncbi:MAG: Uma2 family endonuclease [Blastocatellia bacterium]